MGRPRKPIQRRKNGIYVIQLHLEGRRVVKSLETRDPVKAAARAQQAIAELEAEASTRGQSRWAADTIVTEWDIPDLPGGGNDYANAKPREVRWSEIATNEDEIKRTDWRDLVKEAESVIKRKTGKPFSDSWHRNVNIAIRQCPFSVQEAAPATIRSWIRQMEDEGLSGLTVNSKCSLLSSIWDRCIKSGLLEGQPNPFNLIDYSYTGTANSIPTAQESDYRGLKELVRVLPKKQVIPVLIQAYCGTRISEVRKRTAADFDLEEGTMTVAVGTGKNRSSERTIPLPAVIVEMLKGFNYQWGSAAHINRQLQTINPAISSHSFRHGLTKLGRDTQSNEIAVEALLGHRLSHSEMANRYGGKYGPK